MYALILNNFLLLVKACIEELYHKSNRVIHFNVGNPGAGSDGGVFWEDNIGMALRGNKLGVFWDDNIGMALRENKLGVFWEDNLGGALRKNKLGIPPARG